MARVVDNTSVVPVICCSCGGTVEPCNSVVYIQGFGYCYFCSGVLAANISVSDKTEVMGVEGG